MKMPKYKKRIKAATKKALDLSRKFYSFDPRRISRRNIVWPKSFLVLGSCAQVDYISDKFDGKFKQYFHEFSGPCVLLGSPDSQKNGERMLIILGKFKLTKDGIIG
jgi:hypothetical protein